MWKISIGVILTLTSLSLLSQESVDESGVRRKGNVIYKYKKYQKFDFDDLGVGAGTEGPGDLSIRSKERIKFVNRLPHRRNFNPEMKREIDRIR